LKICGKKYAEASKRDAGDKHLDIPWVKR